MRSSLYLAPLSKFQDQSNLKIKMHNLDRTVESDLIMTWNHKLTPNAFSSGPIFNSEQKNLSNPLDESGIWAEDSVIKLQVKLLWFLNLYQKIYKFQRSNTSCTLQFSPVVLGNGLSYLLFVLCRYCNLSKSKLKNHKLMCVYQVQNLLNCFAVLKAWKNMGQQC